MGKYFTVEVKPTMTASVQHAALYGASDIVFDWYAFDVPSGSSELAGVTALIRGTDGVALGSGQPAFDLIFARSISGVAPATLGGANGVVDTHVGWKNNIIGIVGTATGDWNDGELITMNIVQPDVTNLMDLVLTGEPSSGSNVGYDKIYVAMITKGNIDFRSGLTDDGGHATSVKVMTVADISALLAFDKGDVIHDEDDQLLGTIASVDSATQITLVDNLANASTNNKKLYNLNPITLKLSFEK